MKILSGAFLVPQYIFLTQVSFKADAPTLWAIPPSPVLLVISICIYISIAISNGICISVAFSSSINILINTTIRIRIGNNVPISIRIRIGINIKLILFLV